MNGFEPLRRRITDYTVAGQWQEVYDGPIEECEEFRLKEENAELRELVRIAINHCDSGTCDGCPIQGESGWCPYSDMARKLGIEVSE